MCQGNNHIWSKNSGGSKPFICDCGKAYFAKDDIFVIPEKVYYELSPSQLDYLAEKIKEKLQPSVNKKEEILREFDIHFKKNWFYDNECRELIKRWLSNKLDEIIK